MKSSKSYIDKHKPVKMKENAPFMTSKYEIKYLCENLVRNAQNL